MCPACRGWEGAEENLHYHYRQSPQCRPVDEPPPTGGRDRTAACNLFATRMQAFLDSELWTAHTSHFVSVPHTEVIRTMIISIVCFVISFVVMELRAEAATSGGLTIAAVIELCETIVSIFQLVPTARSLIEKRKRSLLSVEPLIRGHGEQAKLATSFSIVQLLCVMLNESRELRRLVIEASDKWKTGELYQVVPAKYVDATCGSRFRNSATCKKATPQERDDLRIDLHLWNDAFTSVDGMGAKAKENKYEVVLAALLNLPLWMRHYFDNILLLALFQYQWGTNHGGIVGMLCGVNDQGVESQEPCDILNLRAEIRASQARKITIKLPDDSDPSKTEPIERTLILRVLLISLDWLANGAFGPFAESVSANRPCFKCLWTDKCGCAWIARSDKRMDTIVHSALCKRRRLRTHDDTMSAVQEMRLLSATALKRAQTDNGIFSTLFASEYLLDDVVKDATIDIMHIFGSSGLIPYHLSWMLDIYIPEEFSWDDLNACIAAYNRLRTGPHLPKLHRSGKSARLSAKLALTASESIAFALASQQIMEPTLVRDSTTPHWVMWLKLVKLVRFALRRTFDSRVDPPRVQVLYDEFMRSIEHVPQLRGCYKPKHHLPDHMDESLTEHGPWRAYWCMWGEGFLQYLKRLFEMGNYKSAPHTVSTLWAALAVEHYRSPQRTSWYSDTVSACHDGDSEDAFQTQELLTPPITPLMKQACAPDCPLAVRHLSSFTRTHVTIASHTWVMVSTGGVTVVGRISEMLQLQVQRDEHTTSVVRVMLAHVSLPVFNDQDAITLSTLSSHYMCIQLESAHVTLMLCQRAADGVLTLCV